jgi:hypothetical protein
MVVGKNPNIFLIELKSGVVTKVKIRELIRIEFGGRFILD